MVNLARRRTGVFDILNALLMLLICVITLYPFVYLLAVSFSPIEEVIQSKLMLLPRRPTLDAYRYVLGNMSMGSAYRVTITITLLGTVLNLTLSALGAYTLSQRELPFRKLITGFVVLTMIFNAGLIPTFLVVKNLGLIDTIWALILPNAVNSFYMLIMRNFYMSIPASLSESARIDGASELRILARIYLPLSTSILATLALFYGVGHWNQYFAALIYINKQELKTLQVIIRSMYQSGTSVIFDDALPPPVETLRAATIMVATVPILCVYPFLQKYFVKGIMVGAVKG